MERVIGITAWRDWVFGGNTQRTMIGSTVSLESPSATCAASPRKREVIGRGPMKSEDTSSMHASPSTILWSSEIVVGYCDMFRDAEYEFEEKGCKWYCEVKQGRCGGVWNGLLWVYLLSEEIIQG